MRYAFIAALIAAPALAWAETPEEKIVEARQGYFSLLGANMGVFAGMAKGQVDYDAEAAQNAADNIVLLSSYNAGHLFMPGTSSLDLDNTRALPDIWDDMPGVQAKFSDFNKAALAMQEVAGNGKAEMAGALGALGGTCKACHDDYRAD
jgi:cytochrome c556